MELLGIDIGGSGIKGAIVNATTGELVTERLRLPAPPALLRQARTHIPWWMFIRQNTSSGQRPTRHWRLNSITPVIKGSVTLRFAGRLSMPRRKWAKFCCRCLLVKQVRPGWRRSSMS